jgi:threonine dehydratase
MGRSSLDVIVVPSGGGGLLVGAAAVCKPQGVRLFGVEPECGGPDLTEALRHGMRADPEATPKEMDTIADGLRSSTGAANWEHIKVQDNVEGMFTASEHQIKEALKLVIEIFGFIIEPSAAVPVAVVLFNTDFHRLIAKEGGNVKIGIVITGGNASADGLRELIPGLKLNRGMSS